MLALLADSEFAAYLAEVLSLANYGGSATGEVLRAATQVVPHDFESFYTAFNYLGNHIGAIADNINVTQDPVGKREASFRAATYYRAADFFLIGDQSDPRNYELWDKQTKSYNEAISLLEPVPGERFEVNAYSPNVGSFKSIGIFYKSSISNDSAPTVVIGNGYDGSQEESYHTMARSFLSRGMNVATYEGPGQPTVRRTQQLGFIPVCSSGHIPTPQIYTDECRIGGMLPRLLLITYLPARMLTCPNWRLLASPLVAVLRLLHVLASIDSVHV